MEEKKQDFCRRLVELIKSADCEPKLDIRDRYYRLTKYRQCFTGEEFVKWLKQVKHLVWTNNETSSVVDDELCVKAGQLLQDEHWIHHVTSSEPFKNGNFYYRLQCDEEVGTNVLNMHKIYTIDDDSDRLQQNTCTNFAEEVVNEMKKIMEELKSEFIAEDGYSVNYASIKDSELFRVNYLNAAAKLQILQLQMLRKSEKVAFFLNIYNMLVVHGMITYGGAQNMLSRSRFYSSVGYNIGGQIFSLNDIEHGILRGNRPGPANFTRNLGHIMDDLRAIHIVFPVDPRIHFCLNCGAKSCPPIRIYSADKLDEQMTKAAKGFCNSECELTWSDAEPQLLTVHLSMIFKWYMTDFTNETNNERQLLQFISQYVNEEKRDRLLCAINSNSQTITTDKHKHGHRSYKIKWKTYNWALNQ